jgi:hypothetical protein
LSRSLVTPQRCAEPLAWKSALVSDPDLRQALEDAGVTGATADAVVEENEQARLDGLRAAMAVLAVIALAALFLTYRIPTRQPGAPAAPPPP